MQIKELFTKQLDRPINGVVKAEQLDEQIIWTELDEYVVTRELQRHYPWVDEVQLGEEGRPLALHANTRLTGEGHVQLGGSWHSFSFDCLLDPATGMVSRVTYRMNH